MSDEQDSGAGGEYIGPYRLERQLGKGGMGEVYLAYDERLDRWVAVKRIRHQAEASERQRQRFRREARAAAKLSHPAIAQVYDVVFGDDGDSIVMEYVEGRTLGKLLAAGEIDVHGALSAAIQVAEGLAAAHGKSFVHRDLKKENVMVTPEGQAKILDFGLAKELSKDDSTESLTEKGALLGTVSSMSPEQAAGFPVDPRSDLFSFGVLLYEMFTGRSPFRRDNPLQTLHSVVHEEPPPPQALRPELPVELATLIRALLEKDAARRPESAVEVAAALRRITTAPELDLLTLPSAQHSAETWMTAPSDAPTDWAPGGLRPAPSADDRTPTVPAPRPRRSAAVAAIGALVLVTLGVFLWLSRDQGPALRVVVLEPEVTSTQGDTVDLTAFAVLESALGTLATLEGLDPVAPSKVSGSSPTPQEAAREVAADEVLETRIGCRPGWCRVSFRRLRGFDGVTLSVGEVFEVPRRPEDSLDLAHAVGRYLRDAFPEFSPRPETPLPEFQPHDYVAFLELRKRSEAGEILAAEDLNRLAAILESSPRLLGGHLLAAGVARYLGDLGRALEFATAARELAPGDPRPLYQQLQVELAMGEVADAEVTLGRLERLAPGNLLVLRSRPQLLERQGRFAEAAEISRRIVERRSSWRTVLALAYYEMLSGENDSAVVRLENLLQTYPDNVLIFVRLAEVETNRGNLERSAELYRRAAAIRPRSSYFHNQGWIYLLLGKFGLAVEAYERALELAPGDAETRFDLAVAYQAAGREDDALSRYRRILRELEEDEAGRHELIKAQCLIRLGRAEEAIEIADRTVAESPEDAYAIYQAAQIFALAGERIPALFHLGRVRQQGLSPEWLRHPSFRSLEDDSDFQKLLRRGAAS